MRKLLFFILFVFFYTANIRANDSLIISRLGIDKGLSNNSVSCVYQDHNGFMWFGTYDGLNRFDGYQFNVYRNDPDDSTSLPHNYIYAINEDLNHNLWVGTGQGVGIYNTLTSKFSSVYYWRGFKPKKEKINFNITSINCDKKGNVFLGSNGRGLLLKKTGADVAIQVPFESKATGRQTDYDLQTFFINNDDRVYVAIEGRGLCAYDYTTNKITLLNNSLTDVTSIKSDDGKILWIGSTNGLYTYDSRTGILKKAFDESSGKLKANKINSLYVDKEHNLWIGTDGGGINILNILNGEFSYLIAGQDKASLSSEFVFSIYQDDKSRKWIGTLKGGINIIDSKKKPFQSFSYNIFKTNGLASDFVSSFYEENNQNLWIGTDGGGLSIWHRSQNDFTNLKHIVANANSLSNDQVTDIVRDFEGKYWISTFGGGINKYNPSSKSFEHYRCINPENGEENKSIVLLYQDSKQNLWATTFFHGKVYRFNRLQNRFEAFDKSLTDIISFQEDDAGRLWAGDSHKLIMVDSQDSKQREYEIGKPVRAIYEDKNKNLWLGTEGYGLIRFDRKQEKIAERFTTGKNGLCNNSVLSILEDSQGNLWLGTYNGLSKFTPATKSFKNFYKSDGLQSNQFIYRSALRLSSGEMVFGGVKGYTVFRPDSLQFEKNTAPIFITNIRINNKIVSGDDRYVTQKDGNGIKAIEIPYDEAVLSTDFVSPEYSAPDKIIYAYYLAGWDKDWNNAGAARTANYTHLKEGTYNLHIKSTNAAGDWNPNETLLKVTILPPWYRTWLAYIFYIIVLASGIYIYQRYRINKTHLEYEVKLAHLETEKEKELNEKKLSFFTDMSHEFRTPLTLIINPIKDMIDGTENKNKGENLAVIYRNAKRLLGLIDQLLLFRKADTVGDNLKINRINFTNLCHEVYMNFMQEVRDRKIEYILSCPQDVYLYGDGQKIEIALYNLLSNAVKFTPSNGKIKFEIVENEKDILIIVSDTGLGISQDVGDKIFDKFYQTTNTQALTKPGFGIGLSIVKSVANSHNGSIVYNSELNKGSTFILTLPKGDSHFANEFIGEGDLSRPLTTLEVVEDFSTENNDSKTSDEPVSSDSAILVVDDNDEIRKYIINIFKQKYKVHEASSGEHGLMIAREQLPDLIISDIYMGNMSGTEMCSLIKQDSSLGHIPVILLTGNETVDGRLKSIEHGADDYITKPFEKDLLIARVANLLKNRNVLQNYFYNEITLQKSSFKISEEYKEFLERCISIVEKHLEEDDFSIKTIALEIGMSHSNLYRKIKSISGQSVTLFIRSIRLRKAAELFINTNQNINETAFQVGFNDIKYFREQFTKLFGMKPSEYIKKYRKAFGATYRVNKEHFGSENTENG